MDFGLRCGFPWRRSLIILFDMLVFLLSVVNHGCPASNFQQQTKLNTPSFK